MITIIVVLLGLLFPAFQGVQNQAKKTQAKNDLTQIVTAVNAYYTEYGKYPLVAADAVYGPGGASSAVLFNVLHGTNVTENPRQIVFLNPPDAKDATNPRSGIATQDATVNGVSIKTGEFVDPWGTSYAIAIDGDYDNQITPNPYGNNNGAGASPLRQGVIAWSLGKDRVLGKSGKFSGSDDVISWQ